MYNKLLSIFTLFLLVFFVSAKNINAQVIINEFSSNSDPEWVELYNTSSEVVDVTGWTIEDALNHVKPLSGSISAGGFLVYESPEGWLNNSDGDSIIVKNSTSNVIDNINYGSGSILTPNSDKCTSRTPNASSVWTSNISCTKGSANPNAPTSTPTSTPNPTTTSTPTVAPTVAPTPVKTSTPKPKATATPTASPSSSPEVLGETAPPTPSPTSTLDSASTARSNLPIIPIVLVGLGILSIVGAFFPAIKNFYLTKVKGYNGKTNEDS